MYALTEQQKSIHEAFFSDEPRNLFTAGLGCGSTVALSTLCFDMITREKRDVIFVISGSSQIKNLSAIYNHHLSAGKCLSWKGFTITHDHGDGSNSNLYLCIAEGFSKEYASEMAEENPYLIIDGMHRFSFKWDEFSEALTLLSPEKALVVSRARPLEIMPALSGNPRIVDPAYRLQELGFFRHKLSSYESPLLSKPFIPDFLKSKGVEGEAMLRGEWHGE